MRTLSLRSAAVLVAGALAAALLAMEPAHAGTPLTGRIVDAIADGHPGVAGATVRLRELDGGDPGAIVDTDVTAGDGSFSLDAGSTPDDEYFVQLVPGRYQGGYVGGSPAWVQQTDDLAATYAADAAIGTIRANPAYIRGVVVDATTKRPIQGVHVAARSMNDTWQTEGRDTTDRRGRFAITGIQCEDDCYLRLDGSDVAHETGYRACNGGVVATWGAACASPIGRIGRVRLEMF